MARARASSASVATPLALSFAPGSCTCAARITRSSGAVRPRISPTSVRVGFRVKLLAIVTRTDAGPGSERRDAASTPRAVTP